MFDFKALFVNIKTDEKISYHYSSHKSYTEAWEDAVRYFNSRLLEKGKYWIYRKIEAS